MTLRSARSVLAVAAAVGLGLLPLAGGTTVDDPKEIDLYELTRVRYEEGKPLPVEIRKLDGQRVTVRGYMDASQETPEPIRSFRLVTDACGCDGTPKVQHFIDVTLSEEVAFTTGEVILVGTLSVGEEKEGGFVVSIYRLEAESIE